MTQVDHAVAEVRRYLQEVAPERLDAALDAVAQAAKDDRECIAWDEAGHAIAAALCGVSFTPNVFSLLPDVEPRDQAFIWWAGPYARKRAGHADYFGIEGDLSAAGGEFHRYETEEDMVRAKDLAWPQVCELAKQLAGAPVSNLFKPRR